jgi:transposase InsO family protein
MSLDDLLETMRTCFPQISRSSIYRTLEKNGINTVPKKQKEKAKRFKKYAPGYLHMDVTYLPRLEGKKRAYLFIAVDRATRLIFYKLYPSKSADCANDFLEACRAFFPFEITHILTDNGNEFTDRFAQGRKKPTGNHRFDKRCRQYGIQHRLIAPFSPKTNGMVEKANDLVKSKTVKAKEYSSFAELQKDLDRFLLSYTFFRRHGSLQKELNVKTPFDALQKWYNLEPLLFHTTPECFEHYVFELLKQRGET